MTYHPSQRKANRNWNKRNKKIKNEYNRRHRSEINWDHEQRKLNQADGYIEQLIQKEEARLRLYCALFTDETNS